MPAIANAKVSNNSDLTQSVGAQSTGELCPEETTVSNNSDLTQSVGALSRMVAYMRAIGGFQQFRFNPIGRDLHGSSELIGEDLEVSNNSDLTQSVGKLPFNLCGLTYGFQQFRFNPIGREFEKIFDYRVSSQGFQQFRFNPIGRVDCSRRGGSIGPCSFQQFRFNPIGRA